MKTEIEKLETHLICVIEHLEGEHEGKVVVQYDTFNALYEAARQLHAMRKAEEADRLICPNPGMYDRGMCCGKCAPAFDAEGGE